MGTAGTGVGLTWQRSPCLGQCDRGSAALIQHAGPDAARLVLAPVEVGHLHEVVGILTQ